MAPNLKRNTLSASRSSNRKSKSRVQTPVQVRLVKTVCAKNTEHPNKSFKCESMGESTENLMNHLVSPLMCPRYASTPIASLTRLRPRQDLVLSPLAAPSSRSREASAAARRDFIQLVHSALTAQLSQRGNQLDIIEKCLRLQRRYDVSRVSHIHAALEEFLDEGARGLDASVLQTTPESPPDSLDSEPAGPKPSRLTRLKRKLTSASHFIKRARKSATPKTHTPNTSAGSSGVASPGRIRWKKVILKALQSTGSPSKGTSYGALREWLRGDMHIDVTQKETYILRTLGTFVEGGVITCRRDRGKDVIYTLTKDSYAKYKKTKHKKAAKQVTM